MTRRAGITCALALSSLMLASTASAAPAGVVEWPQYGGDQGFGRYSPANLINPRNVQNLKILWTRPAIDPAIASRFPDAAASKNFRATPIMIEGVLYSPNGLGLVEAFDGATGKTIWVQQPFSSDPADVAGIPTRGVAYWKKGAKARIISIRGKYLYALDARTGMPDPAFGEGGRVLLARHPDEPFNSSGGPLVANDVVVVGGGGGGRGTGDYGIKKEAIAESIRAYDVATGRQVWEFSPVPPVGDPARASWGGQSADYAGNMGSYGTFSFDQELGYVYGAFSAPNPPGVGGWRPGDNLYSNTLVALDVRTGRKVWAHQLVRHDLWDYDLSAPPVLGYSMVGGKRVKTVMQIGKVPLLFTFERATGKPIWPIVDRPVPASTAPGEVAAATQPFPSKPAPLDRVGLSEDDLIDFTPELRREALEIYNKYDHGALYTPPSVYDGESKLGVLSLPGLDGGGNWNTGAFDPETGTYYAATMTTPASYGVRRAENPGATVEYQLVMTDAIKAVRGPRGLPLVKPPYGRITAVDMSSGEFRWVTAIGDGPRDHPALKALNLPRLGIPARAGMAVTKSLIFAGQSADVLIQAAIQGGYAPKFDVYDKRDGSLLKTIDLPPGSGTTGAPMTYVVGGKQYVVVTIGGSTATPQWVAFGL